MPDVALPTGFTLSAETEKRCQIFQVDAKTERRFQTVSPELFHFLHDVAEISFNLFLRVENTMIEFIRRHEFSSELLTQMQTALRKNLKQVEICILHSEAPHFHAAIDGIRSKKIQKLKDLDRNLDPKVLDIFGNLSNASQLIVRGGITADVAQQVKSTAAYMVANLMSSDSAIATLSKMVIHDPTLYDHSASVAMLSGIIGGRHLPKPLGAKEMEKVAQCGLYHDVGKTCVPAGILNKPGKFTPEEFEVMKTHTTLGYEELMRTIQSGAPIDELAARVAMEHHERYTGRGYPRNKKGRLEEDPAQGIHLFSRIVAIADVYSALLMKRVYKPAYDAQDAIKVMAEIAREDFDPEIFPAFVKGVVRSLNDYQKKGSDSFGRILIIDSDGKIHENKVTNDQSIKIKKAQ